LLIEGKLEVVGGWLASNDSLMSSSKVLYWNLASGSSIVKSYWTTAATPYFTLETINSSGAKARATDFYIKASDGNAPAASSYPGGRIFLQPGARSDNGGAIVDDGYVSISDSGSAPSYMSSPISRYSLFVLNDLEVDGTVYIPGTLSDGSFFSTALANIPLLNANNNWTGTNYITARIRPYN